MCSEARRSGEAIRLASAGYWDLEWQELPPAYRTQAICGELRRLDAKALASADSGRLHDTRKARRSRADRGTTAPVRCRSPSTPSVHVRAP